MTAMFEEPQALRRPAPSSTKSREPMRHRDPHDDPAATRPFEGRRRETLNPLVAEELRGRRQRHRNIAADARVAHRQRTSTSCLGNERLAEWSCVHLHFGRLRMMSRKADSCTALAAFDRENHWITR